MKRIPRFAAAAALSGWLGVICAQPVAPQLNATEGERATNGMVVVTPPATAPGVRGQTMMLPSTNLDAVAQEKLLTELQELAKEGKWDELRGRLKEYVNRYPARGIMVGGQQNPFMMTFGGELKMIKAAYLGVSISPATPTLRSQLKIPEGMGLAVDRIEKDSPASAAGLQEHDVLLKIDDQWLVNPQQFKVLVRNHKPGDQVKFTTIREGKAVETTVNLIEKTVPALEENDMLPGGRMQLPSGVGATTAGVMPAPPNLRPPVILGGTGGETTVVFDDGNRRYERQFKDGKNMLTVTENGQLIFSGPIDTEEQRAKVPADILKRIDALKIQVQTVPRQ